MRSLVIYCLNFYHRRLSWINGPSVCRFFPTCSEYTVQAVRHYGVLRGLFMGLLRLLRCHPGSQGGYDPLK